MAYFSKDLLLKAYQTICSIHRDPSKQGARQTTSAIKYFLALNMFDKTHDHDFNVSSKQDRNDFVANVGRVVSINDTFYTTDFYTTILSTSDEGNSDFNIGSNFFSTGVYGTLNNGGIIVEYPKRGKSPLFRMRNGTLLEDNALFSNLNYFLGNRKDVFCALSIWLSRNFEIQKDAIHQSTKDRLHDLFSAELVDILLPSLDIFEEYIGDVDLAVSEAKSNIEPNDIYTLFGKTKQAKVFSLGDTNYQTRNFLPALRTKPFLLLAGISGTGKSQIVKEMAFATCPDYGDLRKSEVTPGNYCLVEVKPNWHDSTELLGYDSAIKKHYVVTKFIKFVVKAMQYPEVPFFVCLDEMNLAPVEQYFAEFLSVLESRKLVDGEIISEPLIEKECFQKDIVAYELFDLSLPKTGDMQIKSVSLSDVDLGENAEIWHKLQEDGLCIPHNLIVIGTVNMDETTHQFSRKVIDRAMTFEMNEADFSSYFEDKVTLDYVEKPLDASSFLARNVSGNRAIEEIYNLKDNFKNLVIDKLQKLNEALENTPFKIAYRVQNELVIYFAELWHDDKDANQEQLLNAALDDIMMMKVLPRIEGDDELLGNRSGGALHELYKFATELTLTKSLGKIDEMLKRLERSHFTSFWP